MFWSDLCMQKFVDLPFDLEGKQILEYYCVSSAS